MVIQSPNIQVVKDKAIWKLPELLKREGITPYRLHKDIEESESGKASRNTIYRWSNELPDTLDVALLMSVLYAVRARTGKPLSVCDLLEYREEA